MMGDILEYESENSDDELELVALWYLQRINKKSQNDRRWWVHPIMKKRSEHGEYHRLVLELGLDASRFQEYFRMTREQFKQLLQLCEEDISKQNTQLRNAISARERLAVTIRFLASGDSYRSMAFSYRIAASTIGKIVPEVCTVIWKKLMPIYLAMPKNENDWKIIARNYESMWHLPHCCGALDGKHVVIKCPKKTGSGYYNYKHSFSMVLLALADANYKFINIDMGSYGRNSDGGIFKHSPLGRSLRAKKLKLPQADTLENATNIGGVPYFFVGDEAFPLRSDLMRPYPGGRKGLPEKKAIFNYRLCRARRVVENTFGILAARWRIYHTIIALEPNNTVKIVKATVALHNFLQSSSTPAQITAVHCEGERLQGNENNLLPLRKFGTKGSNNAELVRRQLSHYFLNEGQVPFQWKNAQIL